MTFMVLAGLGMNCVKRHLR